MIKNNALSDAGRFAFSSNLIFCYNNVDAWNETLISIYKPIIRKLTIYVGISDGVN